MYFAADDNCKIYYEVKGKGRPIVFVHGLTGNHSYFDKQVKDLSADYQTVTFDLRGHGASDRPADGVSIPRLAKDLKGLIEYLELEDVVLAGWSLGAFTVWEYIRLFGTLHIGKVIILDQHPKMITDETYPYGLCNNAMEALQACDGYVRNWAAIADVNAEIMFAENLEQHEDKDEFRKVVEDTHKNAPQLLLGLVVESLLVDYRDVLPKIDVPCFVAYADRQSTYTPGWGEYVVNSIPGAIGEAFRGGHLLMMQDAEHLNSSIRKFIERD